MGEIPIYIATYYHLNVDNVQLRKPRHKEVAGLPICRECGHHSDRHVPPYLEAGFVICLDCPEDKQ
jgi:hypothetical protein